MDKSDGAVDPTDPQATETLRSNEHLSELSANLQVLFVTQQLCDITLISADGEYKVAAHKVILASASKYFLAMFGGSLCESEEREVRLNQIDGRTLKAITNFIYKGIIELTTDTVESVLASAHFLELTSLEQECRGYMKNKMDVSNCLGVAALAKHHSYDALYSAAMLCACENFVALRDEDEFHSQTFDQLCELISREDLRVSSEDDVLRAIVAWINYEKDDRKQFGETLLSYVRLPLLSYSVITGFIENECGSLEILRSAFKAYVTSPPKCLPIKRFNISNCKDVIVAMDDDDICLHYFGLNEWMCIKLVDPPFLTDSMATFTILDNKVLISESLDYSMTAPLSRVHCLNLDTFEWTQFPPLPACSVWNLFTLDGTVYAVADKSLYKLAESLEEWLVVVLRFGCVPSCCAYKDLIYFHHYGYFYTYNPAEDIYVRLMRKEAQGFVSSLAIIRHLNSEFLVHTGSKLNNLNSLSISCYNLNTSEHVSTSCFPYPPDVYGLHLHVHGEKIIMYAKNKLWEYDVFMEGEGNLVPIECTRMEIVYTNKTEINKLMNT